MLSDELKFSSFGQNLKEISTIRTKVNLLALKAVSIIIGNAYSMLNQLKLLLLKLWFLA